MNIVEIYERFPTESDCIEYLEQIRWKGEPRCPYCQSPKHTPLKQEHRYHCNTCNTSYSVTVRTIFHRTRMPLQKWFLAICLVLGDKKGISARQLARHIKVNKDTAWSVGMRIRRAMLEQRELLMGIVEMDETYIGGKPRKYLKGDGGGGSGFSKKCTFKKPKTPVVGMVAHAGGVVARPVKSTKAKILKSLVRENIDTENSILITDEYSGYHKMWAILPHYSLNHQFWYVHGF